MPVIPSSGIQCWFLLQYVTAVTVHDMQDSLTFRIAPDPAALNQVAKRRSSLAQRGSAGIEGNEK